MRPRKDKWHIVQFSPPADPSQPVPSSNWLLPVSLPSFYTGRYVLWYGSGVLSLLPPGSLCPSSLPEHETEKSLVRVSAAEQQLKLRCVTSIVLRSL